MSLNTFKKLSSMLLSKHDDIVINEALRQFHEADKNGVKMEYSRGKTRAKINKNIEDYKAHVENEESQFLNYDYDNKEREKKVYNKKHKSIIEVDSKISKCGRKQSIIAIEEAKGYLKRDLTKVLKKMSRIKFDSILQLHFLHHTIDDEGSCSLFLV